MITGVVVVSAGSKAQIELTLEERSIRNGRAGVGADQQTARLLARFSGELTADTKANSGE